MPFLRATIVVAALAVSSAAAFADVPANSTNTAANFRAPTPTATPVTVNIGGSVDVKIVTPAPESKPSPTPTPLILQYLGKTLFVVALSSDAPTAAKISNEVALQVNGGGGRVRLGPVFQRSTVFPEPTWQLADYLTQCSRDSQHTAGALIIMPPVVQSATNNFLIGSSSWTSLDFFALLADCAESGQARVIWKSDLEYSGRANVASVSLLSLLVGYNALANHSGSSSTTTTTTFPTAPATPTPSPFPIPAPTAPPPFVSSQTEATTSNTNGNSNVGLVGTALASALGNTASAGVTSGPDYQLLQATQRAAKGLVTQLRTLQAACKVTPRVLEGIALAEAANIFCGM
jgi:hypothetical protein